MHTDYDPATGRATPTSTTDGSGTSTIIRGYDTLGRLTSLSDSAAGTFTARYDADGQLTTQGYPGGLEARTSYDPTGSPAELAYVKTSNRTTQCTWLDFQATPSIHGQILDQASSLSTQDLTYDAAGRLTQAQDTPVGTGCTIRGYGYDPDSNRTSLTTNPPAADGTCDQAAAGTTGSHAYDAADRLTDPGFAYDPFGRSTTVPAAAAGTASDVTAGYYASDMVRSLTQGSTTHTWTLDPGGRPRTRTDTGGATGTRTNHYADDTDSPAWVGDRRRPGRRPGLRRRHHPAAGRPARRHRRHRQPRPRRPRPAVDVRGRRVRRPPLGPRPPLWVAGRQAARDRRPHRRHAHGRAPLRPDDGPVPPGRPRGRRQRQRLRLRRPRPHQRL